MYITAQGFRLRNDLYCVEWDVKLYYTYTYTLKLRDAIKEKRRSEESGCCMTTLQSASP